MASSRRLGRWARAALLPLLLLCAPRAARAQDEDAPSAQERLRRWEAIEERRKAELEERLAANAEIQEQRKRFEQQSETEKARLRALTFAMSAAQRQAAFQELEKKQRAKRKAMYAAQARASRALHEKYNPTRANPAFYAPP